MINLFLVCGGVSPEHEISIRSAKNILNELDVSKYAIQVIGIAKSGKWFLLTADELKDSIEEVGDEVFIKPGTKDCFFTSNGSLGDVDVIFPILHGPNGEDGSFQGLLQILNIPFVGPGVLGSAVSMDKDTTKQLLSHAGIGVANWITLRSGSPIPSFEKVTRNLGKVVFVKPANMGSSVGVSRVTDSDQWETSVKDAFTYDSKILVEESLYGREMECAVLGNEFPKASGVGEVQSGDVYSYEEKYASGSSAKTIIPAEITDSELKKLQKTAIETYRILECRGLSRVDMFLDDTGNVFVNEVNTMPGFTSISMYPKLWKHEGLDYNQLLDQLIELALSGKK